MRERVAELIDILLCSHTIDKGFEGMWKKIAGVRGRSGYGNVGQCLRDVVGGVMELARTPWRSLLAFAVGPSRVVRGRPRVRQEGRKTSNRIFNERWFRVGVVIGHSHGRASEWRVAGFMVIAVAAVW